MVRAAEELIVAVIEVDEALHPGDAIHAEQVFVGIAGVSAEVRAAIDLQKSLRGCIRDSVIER